MEERTQAVPELRRPRHPQGPGPSVEISRSPTHAQGEQHSSSTFSDKCKRRRWRSSRASLRGGTDASCTRSAKTKTSAGSWSSDGASSAPVHAQEEQHSSSAPTPSAREEDQAERSSIVERPQAVTELRRTSRSQDPPPSEWWKSDKINVASEEPFGLKEALSGEVPKQWKTAVEMQMYSQSPRRRASLSSAECA